MAFQASGGVDARRTAGIKPAARGINPAHASTRRLVEQRRSRLAFDILEDRLAPATITVLGTGDLTGPLTPVGPGAYTAQTLRAAIDGANSMGGSETIDFGAGVFGQTITAAANDTNNPFAFGPTAFVIVAGDFLTIAGSPTEAGVTISGGGTHRIFGVFAGASLTLEYVTLSGGEAVGGNGGNGGGGGGGGAGLGGAVFNNGTLTVLNSTLSGNTAHGVGGAALPTTASAAAAAKAPAQVASVLALAVAPLAVRAVQPALAAAVVEAAAPATVAAPAMPAAAPASAAAAAAQGGAFAYGGGGGGGAGLGGAIFNNLGATLTITNSTLYGNTAQGGAGGPSSSGGTPGTPGDGDGGAVFNLNGTVVISSSTLAGNTVSTGTPSGGALFNLADSATASPTVFLFNSILANTTGGNDVQNKQTAGTAVVNVDNFDITTSAIGNTGGTLNGAPTQTTTGTLNLGPLTTANGGPTATMLPAGSSPAVQRRQRPGSVQFRPRRRSARRLAFYQERPRPSTSARWRSAASRMPTSLVVNSTVDQFVVSDFTNGGPP